MMNKKGSVTLYIILGLVIVLSVGIFLYFQTTAPVEEIESVEELIITHVPEEGKEIKSFIEGCMNQLTMEALEKIGTHGGYIDPNDITYDGGASLVVNPISPTEGQAIEMIKDVGPIVPYWLYEEEPNKASREFIVKIPPLMREEALSEQDAQYSVQSQLENYLGAHMQECLKNFKIFTDKGYEVKAVERMKPSVTISKKDIAVNLRFPLRIKKGSNEFDVNTFYTSIPLNLRQFFQFGEDFIEFQIYQSVFERMLMNLITIYSGVDGDLPPTGGTEWEVGIGNIWIKNEVKDKIQTLLQTYIPALTVMETRNTRMYEDEDPMKQSLYQQMIIPLGINYETPERSLAKFRNLNVNFMYLPSWPIEVGVVGDDNKASEVIRPDTVKIPLIDTFIPGNFLRYRKYYDVYFPVIITLNDPDVMHGKGYTFRFGVEANLVKNNMPFLDQSLIVGGIDTEGMESTRGLICNYNQRKSGDITVTVTDKITRAPIENAEISYTCGETCLIGATYESGQLTERFPLCVGGEVDAQSYGYKTEKTDLNAYLDETGEASLELYPEKHFTDILVRKRKVELQVSHDKRKWIFNPLGYPLDPEEQAIMTFTPMDDENPQPIFLIANGDGTLEPEDGLRIYPGRYNVSVTLILNKKVIIPEDEICGGWGVEGITKECETLDEVEFEALPRAQINYVIELDESIYDKRKITLYTISAPDGFDMDIYGMTNLKHKDLDMLASGQDYVAENMNYLIPTLE